MRELESIGVCVSPFITIVARNAGEALQGINPISYNLIHNSGDFWAGYVGSFITVGLLDLSNTKLSDRFKNIIGASFGSAAVILAETIKLPGDVFGASDVSDIPAGLLGVACYLGISLYSKRVTAQVNTAEQ